MKKINKKEGFRKPPLIDRIKVFFSRLRGKRTEAYNNTGKTMSLEPENPFKYLRQHLEEMMKNPKRESPFEYMHQTLDEMIKRLKEERKKLKK